MQTTSSFIIRPFSWVMLFHLIVYSAACRQSTQTETTADKASVPVADSLQKYTPSNQPVDSWTLLPFRKEDAVNPILGPKSNTEFYCPVRKDSVKWEEKEYIVTVDKFITSDFLTKVSEGGIPEPGAIRKKNFVAKQGPSRFRIVLEPGTNHHLKRVIEGLGYEVVHLQRVRLGDFTPGKLHVGMWRTLTGAEIASITNIVSSRIRPTNIPRSGASDDFFGEETPPRSAARPKSSTGLKSSGGPGNAAKKPATGKRIGKSVPKSTAGSRGSSRTKPATGRNAAPRSPGRGNGAPKR